MEAICGIYQQLSRCPIGYISNGPGRTDYHGGFRYFLLTYGFQGWLQAKKFLKFGGLKLR